MADHKAAVTNVLYIMKEYDLYFKLEKCTFHVPSMDYLGVILEKGVTCTSANPGPFHRQYSGP